MAMWGEPLHCEVCLRRHATRTIWVGSRLVALCTACHEDPSVRRLLALTLKLKGK
jgi:hypothetical protein